MLLSILAAVGVFLSFASRSGDLAAATGLGLLAALLSLMLGGFWASRRMLATD